MRCTDIINNSKLLVFYVGKRSEDEVKSLVANAFECKNVNSAKSANSLKLLSNLEAPREVIESSMISQSRLIMGFNCGVTWRDEDYYAMLLCNEIFGASPISKMFMNIREKLSLCYECSSIYNSARGAIFATTGIDGENYEKTKNAILTQLDDIKQGKISQKEFESAKKSIYNVYSALCDSPNAIERFYLGRIINEIDVDIFDFLKILEDLTVEDVVNAANKLSLHTVYLLRGEAEEREEDFYE